MKRMSMNERERARAGLENVNKTLTAYILHFLYTESQQTFIQRRLTQRHNANNKYFLTLAGFPFASLSSRTVIKHQSAESTRSIFPFSLSLSLPLSPSSTLLQ